MKRTALLLLSAVAFAAAGCGAGSFSQRHAAAAEGTFRYPIPTNPTTLDPHKVGDGDTIDLLQQVFEGLVSLDEQNEIVPVLAERWEVEDGGRAYVFHLKRGVKFHNGEPFAAGDVKYSIERALDPKLMSGVAISYLDDIVGAEGYHRGEAEDVSGVQVLDDHTVRIVIEEPRPYFLGKLCYPTSWIVSAAATPKGKEIASTAEMVGTGPYRAESYAPDQLMVLASFAEYHSGAPELPRIERPVIKDAATRLNKYRGGEIDFLQLERQDISAIEGDPALKDHLQFQDRAATWYIGLNQGAYEPFKDRRVRRAFAMAIDKDTMVDELLGGVNKRADAIVPPGVLGHREGAAALPFDPDRARRELAEAGYRDGKGLPALRLTIREGRPDYEIVAVAVASDLKKNLGVDVTVETMEWRSFLERHDSGKMPFFHLRWSADYPDPQNFLTFLLAGYSPHNHVHYRNSEYDALVRRADTMTDPQERLRLYAQAEDVVLQDAVFVPIYYQRDAVLVRPRVKGLKSSVLGQLPHKSVELE
jgi:oligopeptide transport system substrate-binding protein